MLLPKDVKNDFLFAAVVWFVDLASPSFGKLAVLWSELVFAFATSSGAP